MHSSITAPYNYLNAPNDTIQNPSVSRLSLQAATQKRKAVHVDNNHIVLLLRFTTTTMTRSDNLTSRSQSSSSPISGIRCAVTDQRMLNDL